MRTRWGSARRSWAWRAGAWCWWRCWSGRATTRSPTSAPSAAVSTQNVASEAPQRGLSHRGGCARLPARRSPFTAERYEQFLFLIGSIFVPLTAVFLAELLGAQPGAVRRGAAPASSSSSSTACSRLLPRAARSCRSRRGSTRPRSPTRSPRLLRRSTSSRRGAWRAGADGCASASWRAPSSSSGSWSWAPSRSSRPRCSPTRRCGRTAVRATGSCRSCSRSWACSGSATSSVRPWRRDSRRRRHDRLHGDHDHGLSRTPGYARSLRATRCVTGGQVPALPADAAPSRTTRGVPGDPARSRRCGPRSGTTRSGQAGAGSRRSTGMRRSVLVW